MKVHKLLQTAVVSASLLSVAVAPTSAQVHRDLEPGSLLVFPLFDATPGHGTEIRVTDTNDGPFGTGSVRLHYNIVCAAPDHPVQRPELHAAHHVPWDGCPPDPQGYRGPIWLYSPARVCRRVGDGHRRGGPPPGAPRA